VSRNVIGSLMSLFGKSITFFTKERSMKGKGATIVVLASLLVMFGAMFAQTGSDWQYFNVFNLVEDHPTPYPGATGDAQIPSWYYPNFTTITSYTPPRITEWYGFMDNPTMFIQETPVYGLDGIDWETTVDEDLIRIRGDRAVIRMDLRSATTPIKFCGMKLTVWGTQDFDPNEDLAPIHPDEALAMFGNEYITGDPDSAKNYYTGLQFYVEEWRVTDVSLNDIFDVTDIYAIVEQLGITQRIYTVDQGLPTQEIWDFDDAMMFDGVNIYEWDRAAALDIPNHPVAPGDNHNLYAWQTVIFFQNTITIPAALDPAEHLPFRRIWIALQTTGCHDCEGADPHIDGIEGVSVRDTFFIGFTGPDDFYCFIDDDANHIADAPLGHVDVTPDNSIPSNPEAQRWWRSEPIIGQDTIPPYIYQLYPDNRIGSNGPHSDLQEIDGVTIPYDFDPLTTHEWNSDPSMTNDDDFYVYTADSTQLISWKVKDQQTCIDFVVVEIRHMNGGGFPCRIDSIFFWNPMEYSEFNGNPDHGGPDYESPITFNGGIGTGWLGAISIGTGPSCIHDHDTGSCALNIPYSGYELDWTDVTVSDWEIGVVADLHDTCGLDSFWIAVGNNGRQDDLADFIDGAIVQVTIRAFNRNRHHHYWQCDVGGGLFAEHMNFLSPSEEDVTEEYWQFIIDLSGPMAELDCPTNSPDGVSWPSGMDWLDDETRAYFDYSSLGIPCTDLDYNREDQIELTNVPYTWLADSLPLIHITIYDDYNTVHDVDNHGLRFANGEGGSGFNLRDFEITFYIWALGAGSESPLYACNPVLRTVTVTEEDLIPYDICVCTPTGASEIASAPGAYFDEWDDGTGGELYISFENIYNIGPIVGNPDADDFLLYSGDKMYIVFTRFFDDPDFGQGCMKPTDLDPNSIDLHVSSDASWCGAAGTFPFNYNGNDPNYGTCTMEQNHVPVMPEPDINCAEYTLGYHPDTLGILRIDLRGPYAPEENYYPPKNWTTSDTLQVITVDIYDMIDYDCVDDVSLYSDFIDADFNPRYFGVSGVHTDSIIMNVKVRGCNGSWHPAYNGFEGRNFIINDDDPGDFTGHPMSEPNTVDPVSDYVDVAGIGRLYRNLVIEKIRFHDNDHDWWGTRVVFDPTADLSALKFRPGDEVCVTVYACDNAYTDCTINAAGFGPCPWCQDGEAIAGYWYDGTPKDYFPFTHFVPGMNWAEDMLDPDTHEPIDRQVARFSFYVDPTPPHYVVTDFVQCPFEIRFYIEDISDHVGPLWCDEHINNMGAVDLHITTVDDEDCDGDSINNNDLIIVNDLVVGQSVLIYHDDDHFPPGPPPDVGFTEIYDDYMAYCVNPDPCCTTWQRQGRKLRVTLEVDPDNEQRGAILTMNWDSDGPDDCHFFEPYDVIDVDIYAGDDPQTPWFPASARPDPWNGYYRGVAGPDFYYWYHEEDCYGHIPDLCDAYSTWLNTRGQRRAAHVYSGAGGVVYNYDRSGLATWTYTPRNDFENPNWDYILNETFNILPLISVPDVRWFNDEAWAAWSDPGFCGFNYPPDLHGTFTDFDEIVRFNWVHPAAPISDPQVADSIMDNTLLSTYTTDVYLDRWTRDLNFITFELHTCTDSIVWECRDGDHPYNDSVMNHSPYVRVTAFDDEGVQLNWVDDLPYYEDWYDCDCEHCWLNYEPMRDYLVEGTHGCIDGGRLIIGPIDQIGASYDSLFDTTRVYDTLGGLWSVIDIDTNVYWGGPFKRLDPLDDPDLYRTVTVAGDTEYIDWDDPVYGWQHGDSIVVIARIATRNANQFNFPDCDSIADFHYYCWSYTVDMMPPTGHFVSLVAGTGYEEVNCYERHATNHIVRVRLESLMDAHVGCSSGGTDALWATTWPLPGVIENSDILHYHYHPYLDEPLDLRYNPGTYYLYTNESLVIHNCANEDSVAQIMTFALPITIYHGVEIATGTVFETILNEDTMFIADTLWAEAWIQDRLGNIDTVVSNPMALDNGLPYVKGFAFASAERETLFVEYDTSGMPIEETLELGDINGFTDWDPDHFLLPWSPGIATQDSLVGVFTIDGICTVYVRIWFDDHMDMRDINPLYGHIVRFKPEGWTHWFPIIPIETGAYYFQMAERYADYRNVGSGPFTRLVDSDGSILEEFESPELSDIEPGWNTDREWIGFMVLASEELMDGEAILRIQGFDDNAGNTMLDHEFPFRIESRYHEPTIGWPTPEFFDSTEDHSWEDPYGGGLQTITGYSDGYIGACGAVFDLLTFCNDITAFDFDPYITDSLVFDVFWHDAEWLEADVPDAIGDAYHYVIDNPTISDPDVWYDAITDFHFAQLPCDTFDFAEGTGSGSDTYGSIVFKAFSRFYPEDYVSDTLLNIYIDNTDLTCPIGVAPSEDEDNDIPYYSGDDTLVFPVTTDEITIILDGSLIDEVDYVELVLINVITGVEYSITGGFLTVVGTAPGPGEIEYVVADEQIIYVWDCEGLLEPGLYHFEWRVTNEIYIASGVTDVVSYDVAYHTACCQRDYILVPRESFVARGDDLTDALMKVSCNYPGQPDSDDIYPWIDEDFYPDYPAWVYVDESIVDERDYMHKFQITTFNNPDYTSGDEDPFIRLFTEQGDYMGDSLYILFEVFSGDSGVLTGIDMDIEDEYGGHISGSNPALHIEFDADDTICIEDCLSATHCYYIYHWTVDDQDNRYDGPVEIRVTTYELDMLLDTVATEHPTYVLLDTYDPEYDVALLRYDGGAYTPMRTCISDEEEVAGENLLGETIWVTNADTILIEVTWLQTVFDQDPLGEDYIEYDLYSHTRTWDHLRLTVDGAPHYIALEDEHPLDDPNDLLEARLWHTDLDDYFYTYPFWYQPEGGYDALLTDTDRWIYFNNNVYSYLWTVAQDPTGNGLAKILVKGRDAAGNILDYEEAANSRSFGKFVLIDTDPPTIDGDLVTVTEGTFEADPDAVDDNLLGSGYYDPSSPTPTYVEVNIYTWDGTTFLSGPFSVLDDGSVVQDAAAIGALDSVMVCATDLAGNTDCVIVEVLEPVECCIWDLCPGWNYVALSVEPPSLLVDDVFGEAVYTMCGDSLVEYGLGDYLDVGYGYMVFAGEARTDTICGTPIHDFEVGPLCIGWNLIGVIWGGAPVGGLITDPPGLLHDDNVLYYDCEAHAYVTTDNMEQCVGHLVFVDDVCMISLSGRKNVNTLKKRYATPLWSANMIVKTDDYERSLAMGVADGGTYRFDYGADAVAPPAFPGEKDVYISGHYVSDYRADDELLTWTIVSNGIFSLEPDFSNIPEDYDVHILVKQEHIDLRTVTELMLDPGEYEVIVAKRAVPTEFALGQSFPNPFNAAAIINFQLPEKAGVKLDIFDVSGHKVRTLVSDEMDAGYRSVIWDGSDDNGTAVASGIYLYRFSAGTFSDTKRMILSK